MRAVVLRIHGGPDSLTIEDVPDPVVGPEEVVVRVRATALNRADLLQVDGHVPEPATGRVGDPGPGVLRHRRVDRRAGDDVESSATR